MGGCGTDPSKPPLGRVHGRVTYNGKPLTNGSVIFTPVAGPTGGATGQIAAGQLGSDGSYTLTTFEKGDGAILGQHVVTVEAHEGNVAELNLPATPGAERKPSSQVKSGRRVGVGMVPYLTPKPVIPRKYMDPESTPFRYTVKPGDNRFDLELID
jgi:hypothetical protein